MRRARGLYALYSLILKQYGLVPRPFDVFLEVSPRLNEALRRGPLRQFKFRRFLGAGSNGVVFEARDLDGGIVAVKLMPLNKAWFSADHEFDMTRSLASSDLAWKAHRNLLPDKATDSKLDIAAFAEAPKAKQWRHLLGSFAGLVLQQAEGTLSTLTQRDWSPAEIEDCAQAFRRFLDLLGKTPVAHNDAKLNNLGYRRRESLEFRFIDCARAVTLGFLLRRGASPSFAKQLLQACKKFDLLSLDMSICRHYLRSETSRALLERLHGYLSKEPISRENLCLAEAKHAGLFAGIQEGLRLCGLKNSAKENGPGPEGSQRRF